MPKKPIKSNKGSKIQTTLDQFSSSPSRPSAKSNSIFYTPARPRRRASPVNEQNISDDSDGVGVVKFEKNKPTRKAIILSSSAESDASSSSPHTVENNGPVDRRRRRVHISTSSQSDSYNIPSSKASPPASDEDDKSPMRTSKKGKKRESNPSSDSSAKPRAKKRRRLVKKLVPGSPHSEDSGDGNDLLAELDADHIIESRFRAPKQSAYSRSLDQLKRRKNGRTKDTEEDHENGDSSAASHDSEDDDPLFDAPFEGSVPSGNISDDDIFDGEALGSDTEVIEDSFIVEDDGLGAVALPPEFSMDSHQEISVHFKVICQMYVHMAVAKNRSKFSRKSQKDSYFSIPLSVVRRKLSGLKDSLVASSIWKSDFKSALDYYPQASVTPLMTSVPLCDACHMGGRVATISFRLFGSPYDRETLLLVDASDDEYSDDDGSNSQNFDLGRFCARRARVYHSFSHWEYTLFSALEQEVRDLRNPEESGRGHFVRVNWGDADEVPKDVNDPDQIMDWLDSRGIISHEYSKIKKMMEDARTLESQSKSGYDDGIFG